MASAHMLTERVRSRFEANPKRELVLTNRDERLLIDLYLHRVMSRDHIMRLGYFSSVPACNARLRHLFDHGYLRRIFQPPQSFGAQALYLPGRALVPLVVERKGIDRAEAVRITGDDASPMFLSHTLKVVDLRICLERHASAANVTVEKWLSEAESFHEFELKEASGVWKPHALRPDAFVRLRKDAQTENCFLEIDLGHVSSRLFKGKLDRYASYLRSGVFAATYGYDSFTVLTSTSSYRRLSNLLDLAKGFSAPNFLFTTFDALSVSGPYWPIWRPPSSSTQLSLFGVQS